MSDTLTVEHSDSTYLVDGEDAGVRERLDRVARGALLDAWGRALDSRLDPADRAVWVVDGVHAELIVDLAALDDRGLGALWADALADSLAAALAGAAGAPVRRFDDFAAFAAEFAVAVAEGRAWERWEFAPFEGLRPLPSAAAIRAGLLRDAGAAWPALRRLHRDGRLEQVLAALGEDEARILYEQACARQAGVAGDSPGGLASIALRAWPPAMRHHAGEAARDAIRLHVAMLEAAPDLAGAAPARVVPGMVALACALRERGGRSSAPIVRGAGMNEILTSGAETAGEAAALVTALAADGRDVEALLARVAEVATGTAQTRERAGTVKSLATPFGGAFLLLPGLLALGGERLEPLLRHRVLASAMGGPRAGHAWDDPGVQLASGVSRRELDAAAERLAAIDAAAVVRDVEAMGVDPEVTEADAQYLAAALPGGEALGVALLPLAAAVLRGFARRLIGFASSGPEFLHENFMAGIAAIRVDREEIAVALPRVPLDVVLRMAGVDGQTFVVPWLDDATVTLTLPGA